MSASRFMRSSPLLGRLLNVIRERLHRLNGLRIRLLRVPELDERDFRDLYLNP